MEHKTCYYCGTKYSLEDECCPLCGQTETEPEALDEMPVDLTSPEEEMAEKPKKSKKSGARAAKRSNAISTVICILLAIAVAAGALFILTSLGVLSFEKKPADNSSLSLPVEDETPDAILCTGIDLAPDTIAFNAAGDIESLIVITEPADCTEEITYHSSDESVATVSSDGKVTAVGSGRTEITVSCGEFAKSMEVICEIEEIPEVTDTPATTDEPAVNTENLTLSTEDFTLFEAGETATIQVQGLSDGASVQWSSSNESIAAVKDGKVTAVGGGTTTITATVGGKSLKCIVRCKFESSSSAQPAETTAPSGDFVLSHDDVTVVPGESFTIRLVQGDSRVQGVSWATTDGSVCSVSADGTVTAAGSGTAKVIGTYNGVEYTCIVRCN